MTVPPSEAIVVMARAPQPGRVKTRLIPELGAEGACDLHARLLQATLAVCLASGRPVFCFTTAALDAGAFDPARRVHWAGQSGGDLGQRMQAALARLHARFARLLLVGSDCPVLDTSYLDDGFAQLARHDFVLGPAEDGGYVLIGSSLPSAWLGADRLAGTRFGGPHACQDTRAALTDCGTLAELATLWDIDDGADLLRARESGILASVGMDGVRSTPC